MRSTEEASPKAVDPWRGTQRIVQVRPHLWRWLAPMVGEGAVLEIGPGLRPTAPVRGSHFVDRSSHALARLAERGGTVARMDGRLPLVTGAFAAVLAFEVLEHVEDDEGLLEEIARVLRPGGVFLLSTPIRMSRWSPLDEVCGHVRRYEPEELFRLLRARGFEIEGYLWSSEGRALSHRARAGILRANRRAATALVQTMVFPVQAAYHRAFGRVRWVPAEAPIPAGAAGLTIHARRRDQAFNLGEGGAAGSLGWS